MTGIIITSIICGTLIIISLIGNIGGKTRGAIMGVLANIKDEIRKYEAECKSENQECNQCNDVTFKSIIAIIESEEKKYD